MLPHGPEVNHVIEQQQGLLLDVSHVPSLALLKISNGGIIGERNSIQHQRRGPGWNCRLLVTPHLTLTERPRLYDSGLFGPLLGLNLLEGVAFSYFHHLFTLLFPLPLMVGRIKSEGLGGWKGGKPSLGCLPRCVSPNLGLQQLLES